MMVTAVVVMLVVKVVVAGVVEVVVVVIAGAAAAAIVSICQLLFFFFPIYLHVFRNPLPILEITETVYTDAKLSRSVKPWLTAVSLHLVFFLHLRSPARTPEVSLQARYFTSVNALLP